MTRTLEIYPTQLRAFNELNGYLLFTGRHMDVLLQSQDFSERVEQWRTYNASPQSRTLLGLEYFNALHNLNMAGAILIEKGPNVAEKIMNVIAPEVHPTRFANTRPYAQWRLLMARIKGAGGDSETATKYRNMARGYGADEINILRSTDFKGIKSNQVAPTQQREN